MESLINAAWVALGAAIGGPARAFLSGLIGRHFGDAFPLGTLVVNVTGAFAIGIAGALLSRHALASDGWLFAVTGVLGSYTTVSSFSLQTVALAQRSAMRSILYVVLSVLLCVGAVALGFSIAGGVP
ncbi:MAG TPA: fluoride efflux transporter CrcB [Caulobacterales bacterium]|nr:fluoride efflux transporter CrcB [Caulobacterales bacterium]